MPRSAVPTFRLRRVWILLAAAAACAPRGAGRDAAREPQTVILISIDGFRADYLDRYRAPHLAALAARGVRARWLEPSFPVLTFPNHYTIVTGLSPANHGIVGNTMVDPSGARFRMHDSLAVRDSRWWGGEPIWVTAEKQGVRAGSFFWPGSEAEIGGHRPTFSKPFDDEFPVVGRVDTVLAWLTRPDSLRSRLVLLYFSTVDHAGHDDGPNAESVQAAILAVDSAIGRLVGGIEAAGLTDRVNVVIVADHGMAEVSPDRRIVLDDYLDPRGVDPLYVGAVLMLQPRDHDTTRVLRALRLAPHLKVYSADSTPAHWRFRGNPRIPGVIGVPDEGWIVDTRARQASMRLAPQRGAHGFEPADSAMRAVFIAAGPGLHRGLLAPPLRNIHVYELLAALLGVRPAPNEGSLDSVRAMLR